MSNIPYSAREIAERIVNEDARDEHGGYAYWIENHSCGSYGCCGGGKEIDKIALKNIIEREMREAIREAFRAGFTALLETKDNEGNNLTQSRWVFNGFSIAHDLEPAAWMEWQRVLDFSEERVNDI